MTFVSNLYEFKAWFNFVIQRKKFVTDIETEAVVGRSSFVNKDKDRLREILKIRRKISSTWKTDVEECKGQKAVLKIIPGRTDLVYGLAGKVTMEVDRD